MSATESAAERAHARDGGLVGRTAELSLLRRSLDQARNGRGTVLLIAGEAGIGKTRLAQELAGIALAAGVRVAWGRCSDAPGQPPLWPWREVLRSLGLPESLLSGAESGEPEDWFRIADEIVRRLAREADEGHELLVIVDDVHWADPTSLLVLRHLAARAGEMSILLVVMFRPPESVDELSAVVGGLTSLPTTVRVELRGLSVDHVGEQLAGAGVVPDPAAVLHEITGGNPLFVGELARAMAAGAWDPSQIPPQTVLEVARARVARLSETCQALLGWAAVAGSEFDLELLARASAVPIEQCIEAFDEARAHRIVERQHPPARMRFVHTLLRDALSASLDDRTRIGHHAALAREIETQRDAIEHAALLAEHWLAAAPVAGPDPARGWAIIAAEHAVRRLAYEEGVRRYGAALTLGDLDRRERCDLLLALGRAAYLAGDLARSAGAAQEAGLIAEEVNDVTLLARAAFVLDASTDQHVNAVARTLCGRALSRIDELDVGVQARLLAQRTHIAFYGGEVEMTQSLSQQALAVARKSGEDDALMEALRSRQEARPGADGRDERAKLAEEMVTVAERAGDARSAMWGHLWAIDTMVEEGRLADAAARLERLSETVERVGGPVSAWLLDRCIACIAHGRGDDDTAAAAAQRGYDRMRIVEPEAALGAYLAIQCAISHHRGTTDAGLTLAQAPFSAPALFTVMRRTGRALLLARAGLNDAAAMEYELAGPPSTWRLPPFYVLPALVVGALAASALGRLDDVRTLVLQLEPFRGQHVVGGAGVVTYLGPVEVHLGSLSLQLADVDTAIEDLTRAEQAAERGAAPGYIAEARHHLALALLERDPTGDLERVRSLAQASRRTIHALNLHALVTVSEALAERVGSQINTSVLSPREEQIASLVAQGLTNPQIAERLIISRRTAQNHVQHILTKLGFTSRSQIAAWRSRS